MLSFAWTFAMHLPVIKIDADSRRFFENFEINGAKILEKKISYHDLNISLLFK